MDAKALRTQLDEAKTRIAESQGRQSAMSSYIDQLHRDFLCEDERERYCRKFCATFGRSSRGPRSSKIEDLIGHEFASRPFSLQWGDDAGPIQERLAILRALPNASTHILEAYVGFIARFADWLKVEVAENQHDLQVVWHSVGDEPTRNADVAFYEAFNMCQQWNQHTFRRKADMLVKPIEAVWQLKADLRDLTKNPEALQHISKMFKETHGFLGHGMPNSQPRS